METDRTTAVALQLAKDHLEKLGWKYKPQDIGIIAAQILAGMKDQTND